MDVQVPNRAGAFAWPERFFNRRKFPSGWENSSWLEARLKAVGLTLADAEEEHLLHSLRTAENWAADKFRLDLFLDVLRGATLRQLVEEDDSVPENKVALLIDSNNIGTSPVFRPFLGGLTARQLLREASKKRYNEEPTTESSDFIEAERRLIYVVDLNAWAIVALLASSPESLCRNVTRFIYNYLVAKCSIGVSFATEGPDTFLLQLSLPIRAFRETTMLKNDDRKKRSNEEPLRSSTEITFLRSLTDANFDAHSIDVIYSSHMSVMVTGYDQRRWTGVALIESWFEDELDDPSPDMIARYEKDSDEKDSDENDSDENDPEDEITFDPLCRGRGDATKSEWEPRQYYIRVFEVRLNHVYGEWESLYGHLEKIIKAAPKKHKKLLKELLKASRIPTARQEAQRKVDEFEVNIGEAEELLIDLAQVLDDILSSASIFMETDVQYFLQDNGPNGNTWNCVLPLSQVRGTLNEMSNTHRKLGVLQTTCKSMLDRGAAERQKYVLQLKINEITQPLELKVLSWTTIMSQPLLNIAAVFSCDGIITVPRTWYYFLCAFFLMVAAMGFIVVFLLKLLDSGASLFQSRHGDRNPTQESSDSSAEGQVTAPVDTNNSLPRRRPTFCTSGMDYFRRRRRGDIGLLELPGQIC
ncbi:hypothetical protein CORC01_03778 [Colletotrichum orchidophilum]|uniref:Uncharacterized protein n=1 Tax=Colletotrichum orchidophilum TaxID=1209926 RepID=A0A1G4BHF3_9PEZI|nr:uncharacterized protein CORC01_03778 [Colletotrichum orchidophilum]OHF00950.1 hypothetical protein CORC01_03778 [Colletotrichum orchidophilum]